MIKIAKIENDKYYTPIDLANYCWDKVYEIIVVKCVDFVVILTKT
jgi:hypothetical protein